MYAEFHHSIHRRTIAAIPARPAKPTAANCVAPLPLSAPVVAAAPPSVVSALPSEDDVVLAESAPDVVMVIMVDTIVLPMLSVVVMTAPPANVPLDMVELLELPIIPEGLAEPLEFVLPPIRPPVGDIPPVEIATADVTVAVALTTVAETVAVELDPPLAAIPQMFMPAEMMEEVSVSDGHDSAEQSRTPLPKSMLEHRQARSAVLEQPRPGALFSIFCMQF